MIEAGFLEHIAGELSIPAEKVAAVIAMLDSGATIPFVAHYRKDVAGNLDEEQVEAIADQNAHFIAITNRRAAILDEIEKQGLLTDDLRAQIQACMTKWQLENQFLPFKAKRRTKATMAEEQGLTPLADFMLKQLPGLQQIEEFVTAFVKPERSISSPQEAIEGVCYILAERFALDPEIRRLVRERMMAEGKVTARPTKNAEGTKTKFESYYGFSEPIGKIPSHRLLALLRGAKEGILRIDVTMDDAEVFNSALALKVKDPGSIFEPIIKVALEEAYTRQLRPAIENDVMELLHKHADEDAVRVFRQNAVNILMAPPAGAIPMIGAVLSAKKGCKVAVVDANGNFVEHQTIFIANGEPDAEQINAAAEQAMSEMMERHQVYSIAVGSNGAATKDVVKFMKKILGKLGKPNSFAISVNAAPAADYATSKEGRQEFEDLEATVREAISIARLVQDPLAELVKVEPRSIGVGQYQHDVNQKLLREGLHRTVASCVNNVGVDLNRASVALLRYVSGLQTGTAQNIVETRARLGGFKSREQLKEVGGITEKVYEQCAGFLRVASGDNLLDKTSIHPEAYDLVRQIASTAGLSVSMLIGNREAVEKVDFNEFRTDVIGPFTLSDVKQQLLHPGRDVRSQFRVPKLIEGISSLDDLKEGMEVEGVVTNVTDFGAFVDIGMQQDGLVHLSELSNRFVKDPREVIKVGDVVKVKVIKVNKQLPRISLSIKALLPEAPRRGADRVRGEGRAAEGQRPPRQDRPPRDDRPREQRGPARTGAMAPAAAASGAIEGAARDHAARDRRRRPDQPEESRRSRPARPDGREREMGREQRFEGQSDRPPRRSAPDRGAKKPLVHADAAGERLNTLLSDQLAALKERLKP